MDDKLKQITGELIRSVMGLVALIRQAWNELSADLREWWVFGNDIKRDFILQMPVLQK